MITSRRGLFAVGLEPRVDQRYGRVDHRVAQALLAGDKLDELVGALQSVPGSQVIGNFVATNASVLPSLGRPLAGGAANATVNVVPPGALYGDRRNQLDLRLGKVLRFGRTRTKVNLDINNVFNANPVLTENSSFAVFRQPASILPARIARVGVQFDF